LLGVGDEQGAVDVLHPERGEPGRGLRVGELAGEEGVQGKVLVEDVHRAVVEVGGVQVVRPAGAAHVQPFVNRPAGRPVGAENRLGRVHGGVEAGDGAVLGGEEDRGGGAAAVFLDHEVRGGVGHLAGGGGGGAGRAAAGRWDDDGRAQGGAVGGEQGG